ncbi:MAG: TRAP transporter small permease [Microbacteriaceae bacterium]
MIDKIMTHAEKAILVIAFSVSTGLVFVNVVSRYALHGSFSFTSELVVNLAVLMIMVGSSLGIRYNTHPGFTVFRDGSKGLTHKIIVALITIAIILFLAFIFWYGLDQAMRQFASGRVTPALGIPQGLFSLALPLGAVLAFYRAIQQLVWVIQGKDLEEGPDYLVQEEED